MIARRLMTRGPRRCKKCGREIIGCGTLHVCRDDKDTGEVVAEHNGGIIGCDCDVSPEPSGSSTVTVDQTLEGWGAKLHIGHQHFTVGPQDYEEKSDAEWMATMLRIALGKMNAANQAPSGGEAVPCSLLLAAWRLAMRTIEELQAYKAKAKRQRDNWKRRAEVYRVALEEIAAGPCCGCCADDDPQCDVGMAKDALRIANAESEGQDEVQRNGDNLH